MPAYTITFIALQIGQTELTAAGNSELNNQTGLFQITNLMHTSFIL